MLYTYAQTTTKMPKMREKMCEKRIENLEKRLEILEKNRPTSFSESLNFIMVFLFALAGVLIGHIISK